MSQVVLRDFRSGDAVVVGVAYDIDVKVRDV